jgi:hypothetical protein
VVNPYEAAAMTALDCIKKVFSVAPRGNYQKFQREAYPLMLDQAKATGRPVDAYWFQGEIVRVYPDGQYGVTSRAGTLEGAWAYWRDLAVSETFYVLQCQDTLIGCSFQLMGSGEGRITPDTATTGMSMLGGSVTIFVGLIVVAGLVLWFTRGKK